MDTGIGVAQLSWFDWVLVALYFVAIISIGLWFYRRVKEFDDFLVAGRSLTLPILVGTLISSYYCGMYFFADAGFMYAEGIIADFAYYPPYYYLVFVLAFFLVSRLRILGEMSLPDVLDRFYGKLTRVCGALGSFLYCVPVMQLMAIGLLLNVLLGWPLWLGALVGGLLAIVNTLLGGLWALAFTDMLQFTLMFFGVTICLPIALKAFGGWSNVLALNPEWHLDPTGGYLSWAILGVYAVSAITILVEPVFYQRFFAARDHKTAVRAFMAMIVMWMFIDRVIVAMGLITWAKYPGFMITQDQVVFTTILEYLPYGLSGLFVIGVIAAIVGTIDAYTLVGAANISYDIINRVFRPQMSEKKTMTLTRVMILVTFVLSYAMMFIFPRIMLVWLLQSAVLIAVAVIPILGAFLWPFRKSALGGTLSATVGLIVTLAVIIAVFVFGTELPGWDTIIWEINIFGVTIHFWAEMVMYVSIFASLLAYIVGNFFGTPLDPQLYRERRALS
ncbi:MAG: sodium:solute symporter family protein [Dethiobacteria bacterium]